MARLLSPSEYGLVSVALIIPSIFNIFEAGGWGTGDAMTKYIAECRAQGQRERIGSIIYTGLIFRIIPAAILTLLACLTAPYLTIRVFDKPAAVSLAVTASFMVFTGSLYTFAFSIFLGFEKMHHNSVIIICSSILKGFLIPFLIIVGFGTMGSILGYLSSSFLAAVVGLVIIFFMYRRRLWEVGKPSFILLRKMLRYGTPLALGSLITVGFEQYGIFLSAVYSTADAIGNFAQALKFSVLTDVVLDPIMVTLFPTFARLNPETEKGLIKRTFEYSVRYSALLTVPIGMWTLVLSQPLTLLVLGAEYTTAWFYLDLMAIGWLYVGLGMMPLIQLFTGLGDTKLVAKVKLIPIIVGFPLASLLIPLYGVVGQIVVGLITPWPTYLYAMRIAKARYAVEIPIKRVIRIYAASAVATGFIFALTILNLNSLVFLAVSGVIAVTSYLALIPTFGAIDRTDIQILASTFGNLPYIGMLVTKILTVLEKLV